MAEKRTYYPVKTFDDDLAGFAGLLKEKGWSFPNVDAATLETDAAEARAERLEHDALERKFDALHQTYGERQEARFERYSAALNAARGAFRNDAAVTKELESFKRSADRAKKKED